MSANCDPFLCYPITLLIYIRSLPFLSLSVGDLVFRGLCATITTP